MLSSMMPAGSGSSGTKRRQPPSHLSDAGLLPHDDDAQPLQPLPFRLDDADVHDVHGAGKGDVAAMLPASPSSDGLPHTRSRSKRLSRSAADAPPRAHFSGMDTDDIPGIAMAHVDAINKAAAVREARPVLADISNKAAQASGGGAIGQRGDKRPGARSHVGAQQAALPSAHIAAVLPVRPAAVMPLESGADAYDEALGGEHKEAQWPGDDGEAAASTSFVSHDADELDALNASTESTGSGYTNLGVHVRALRIQHDSSVSTAGSSTHPSTHPSHPASAFDASTARSMPSAHSIASASVMSERSVATAHAGMSITEQVYAHEAASASAASYSLFANAIDAGLHHTIGGHQHSDVSSAAARLATGAGPVESPTNTSAALSVHHASTTPNTLPSEASTLTGAMASSLQLHADHKPLHAQLAHTAAAAAAAAAAASHTYAAAAPSAASHAYRTAVPEMPLQNVASFASQSHGVDHAMGMDGASMQLVPRMGGAGGPASAPAAIAGTTPPLAAASSASASLPSASAPTVYFDSPSMCYSEDIWACLLASETKYLPNPSYMELVQTDLSHLMRSILMDWLIEVALEYDLESQTLFLCIGFVDRFLSVYPVDRAKLQLLGVAAMLLASKYWEQRPPTVEDLIYISDRTYSREQVLAMEGVLLGTLNFACCQVTPWECASRIMAEMGAEVMGERTRHLTNLLMELFVLEPAYLCFRPSVIAVSALFLALYTTHQNPWPASLESSCGLDVDSIQACVKSMHSSFVRMASNPEGIITGPGVPPLLAIRDKYAGERYGGVADIKPRVL